MSAAVASSGSPTARRSTTTKSQSQENEKLEGEKGPSLKVRVSPEIHRSAAFCSEGRLSRTRVSSISFDANLIGFMNISYSLVHPMPINSPPSLHVGCLYIQPYRATTNLACWQVSATSLKKSATALASSKLGNQAPKVSSLLEKHLKSLLNFSALYTISYTICFLKAQLTFAEDKNEP